MAAICLLVRKNERGIYALTFAAFLSSLATNPVLFVTVLLTLGVVFVNGWTDAPNAIATCVSTRSLGARPAILMAAVCNFLGILVMTSINATVAQTIYNMVDFGENTQDAVTALCAAMAAIVLWAVAAWFFGIPTSESHALIAGLTGAAIAIQHGFDG
ncbi:MAG: inorganic phosphate transporter, partial [Oscillospiraceae bacterium]|nr:inorganic phosphate transporter [Oscillospiraceae bacterium]